MSSSDEFKTNVSRTILIRLALVAVVAAAALAASLSFLSDFYTENQLTPVGLTINGGILLLFALGLSTVVWNLIRYAREETAIAEFAERLQLESHRPLEGVDGDSLIALRYEEISNLGRRHAPINHSALAATLQARESTRLSFPRFIHNILILTGVFGTIVSLSIALVGASNLLDTVGEVGNMGLVIHGMSTALSTTITAIVCYLFYGYFFLKLTDVQTQVLSAVEQLSTLYLVPKFAHTTETVVHELAGMLHTIQEVTRTLRETQATYDEAGRRLVDVVSRLGPSLGDMREDLAQVKHLLREGFRLPAGGRNE